MQAPAHKGNSAPIATVRTQRLLTLVVSSTDQRHFTDQPFISGKVDGVDDVDDVDGVDDVDRGQRHPIVH